jgi:hypothetical protein
MMTVLFERTYPRTLAEMVRDLPARVTAGELVEVWCFEDESVRRDAEARLKAAGVTTRIRSAYKPLVHAFLEELPREGLQTVRVAVPVVPEAAQGRFELEAYPLSTLLGGATLAFAAGATGLDHAVTLIGADGSERRQAVFAPNVVRVDHAGERILAPSGWLRIGRAGEAPRVDEPVACEIEALFLDVMAAIAAYPFALTEPQFERLVIEAAIPAIRRPLGFGDEVADTVEALHEEFYFSLLEFFARRSGRRDNARDLRPGQIVPLIRATDGPASVSVRLEFFGADGFVYADDGRPFESCETPLTPDRVAAGLAALGGEPFASHSREGRPVAGTFCDGEGPGVVISGGQHANEATGIVGALRAGAALKASGRRFAVTPLENPDGYALHHRLRSDNPAHMHHAARYTALGDDLGHRWDQTGEVFELAARQQAFARSGARLHINLHGYPSHEWTRPFTGYVPRNFALWAVPKGFFLVVRHQEGWGEFARAFTQRLAHRLAAELPAMLALNATQMAAYHAHIGRIPFDVIAGIPCQVGGPSRATAPIEFITEYPDETIAGEAFRLAHECQFRAAVAAADIFAQMYSEMPAIV